MKTTIWIRLLTLTAGFLMTSKLEATTKISVTEFENKANGSGCAGYWRSWLGSGFKEMLMTKLSEDKSFELLERETIRQIYSDEHELVNSQKTKKPKKGQFKVADFTLVGAVTEFEYCESGGGLGVDVGRMVGIGSLTLSGKKRNALVAVDVRVINVETGAIIKSVRTEGKVESSSVDIDADLPQFAGDFEAFENSPLGEASRVAIDKASDQIISVLKKQKS